ncbi:hypothetical protein CR162_13310 [Pseudoroseomonas rhizosphaerae]|uniref:Uncharacterized protein n=1 Tax=Teichococcus rhizosphaerae TaxID=1335062 RepID=A0A2C7AA04_9PROT|nr:hypothetical protein [Pseudoroseomonas rhizosphaerae]PHK94463.1 hypothetical protein CR162_13310 [Pseudoroseomonas rhizosphaerae]
MRFFEDGITLDIDAELRKKHASDITIPVFRFDADPVEGFNVDKDSYYVSGTNKQVLGFFRDLLSTSLGSQNGGDVSGFETGRALGTKEIIVSIGDDVFVYAPGNARTINVSARDDVFVYAPGNKGNVIARGDDVFIFAPDNDGGLNAFARSVADAAAKAKGSAPNASNIVGAAKAEAEADAYTFIYANNNDGRIHASADSDASARAEADVLAQRGDAKAVAVAVADAEAKILVYAPGSGTVTTSNDADATANAFAVAESRQADATALTDSMAIASAETSVILQGGGYDHFFFA